MVLKFSSVGGRSNIALTALRVMSPEPTRSRCIIFSIRPIFVQGSVCGVHWVHMAACRTELAKRTFAKRMFAKRTFRPCRASTLAQEQERRAHTHAIEPQKPWLTSVRAAPRSTAPAGAAGRSGPGQPLGASGS